MRNFSTCRTKTFEEIQAHFNKQKTIKFKNKTKKDFKDFKEVLSFAIVTNDWGKENSTIFADNKKRQCGKSRMRGLGDLYRIVHYYYPKVTFEEFYNYTREKFNYSYCVSTFQNVFRGSRTTTYPHNSGINNVPKIRIGWESNVVPLIK